MRDGAYRKRLAGDLPKWREAGWVTADGAAAILAGLAEGRSGFAMAAIVGTLGALLIGLGVIAFIASGWDALPRIVRFALLIAGLALAYAVAAIFRARGFKAFSEAALLVAGLVFAAAIALIGQTYHLAGDFSGAVLLWEIGIIGGALLAASSTLAVLGLVGAGYWTWLATVEGETLLHWPSLAAILLGGAIALWLRAHYARIVAVLALGFWICVAIIAFATRLDWPFAGTMALFAAAALALWSLGAALAASRNAEGLAALGGDLYWLSLLALLAALGFEQLAALWGDSLAGPGWRLPAMGLGVAAVLLALLALLRKGATAVDLVAVAVLAAASIGFALWHPGEDLPARLAGGVIVLAAALWATSLGQTGEHPRLKTLGLFAFGVEVFYLYVVTLGTEIDTAAAFLIGGVLFIALAYGLYRLDKRLAARAAGQAP